MYTTLTNRPPFWNKVYRSSVWYMHVTAKYNTLHKQRPLTAVAPVVFPQLLKLPKLSLYPVTENELQKKPN